MNNTLSPTPNAKGVNVLSSYDELISFEYSIG